jgi:hypothetical protein
MIAFSYSKNDILSEEAKEAFFGKRPMGEIEVGIIVNQLDNKSVNANFMQYIQSKGFDHFTIENSNLIVMNTKSKRIKASDIDRMAYCLSIDKNLMYFKDITIHASNGLTNTDPPSSNNWKIENCEINLNGATMNFSNSVITIMDCRINGMSQCLCTDSAYMEFSKCRFNKRNVSGDEFTAFVAGMSRHTTTAHMASSIDLKQCDLTNTNLKFENMRQSASLSLTDCDLTTWDASTTKPKVILITGNSPVQFRNCKFPKLHVFPHNKDKSNDAKNIVALYQKGYIEYPMYKGDMDHTMVRIVPSGMTPISIIPDNILVGEEGDFIMASMGEPNCYLIGTDIKIGHSNTASDGDHPPKYTPTGFKFQQCHADCSQAMTFTHYFGVTSTVSIGDHGILCLDDINDTSGTNIVSDNSLYALLADGRLMLKGTLWSKIERVGRTPSITIKPVRRKPMFSDLYGWLYFVLDGKKGTLEKALGVVDKVASDLPIEKWGTYADRITNQLQFFVDNEKMLMKLNEQN